MIKEVNGKKYIFINDNNINLTGLCKRCVAQNDRALCMKLVASCAHGFFKEESQESPQQTTQEQMTIRDQFAMAALNGLVASNTYSTEHGAEFAARTAYAFADAMMKARTK